MSAVARLLSRWIPAPIAARALLETQEQLLWELHKELPPPDDGDDPVVTIMERLGVSLGRQLQERFGLTRDRHGAVVAWRITSRLGGLRLAQREESDRTIFDHTHCPLWERFRAEGELSCPRFCEPLARGIACAVAPDCRMEMVRAATLDVPCAKALVDG